MMRTRFTKVLALILALVMTIGLLPMSAMATEETTNPDGLITDKTISGPDASGVYTLNLEAYTTGSVSASSAKPLDIVLVLDTSGSMNDGFGKTTTIGEKNLLDTEYYDYDNSDLKILL
jgi:hypothetical protein